MRILTLSYEFPPLGGGGSRVVAGLTRELVALGCRVDLITMGQSGLPASESVDGVRVHRVPCVRLRREICTPPEMLGYDWAALRELALRDVGRYDINHTHFIYPDGLVAWRLAQTRGLPFVVTAHGSDVPGFNPDRFRALHALSRPLWRRIARAASSVVFPSRSLRALASAADDGLRADVIPNGYDPARMRADRERTRRVLVVSRLFERKGVQHLLRGLDALPPGAGVRGWTVEVVGDGPYLPALKRVAEDSRLDVRFHGWIDNDDPRLRELYESAGIFVLPSISENFPIVLLEAMAAGAPIVTVRGSGSEEVVGDAAMLVPAADAGALGIAVDRLAGDATIRARLAAAARARLEARFSWRAVATSYLRLFERHRRAA